MRKRYKNYHNIKNVRSVGRPLFQKKVMVPLIIAVSAIAVGQLVVSNYFVTKGTDLAFLEAKKEKLTQENDMLKARLAQDTSLQTIAQKAKDLGLIETKVTVFVPNQTTQPLALQYQATTP